MNEQGFAHKLLRLRKGLGLTQEEFALQLGLNRGSYSDIERGKVKDLSGPVKELLAIKFGFGEPVAPLPVKEPEPPAVPQLELVPAKITERESLSPTIAFKPYKGRISFNRATVKLLGLTRKSWVAFYQDKTTPANWYIAVEAITGAIPLLGNSTLLAHNLSISEQVLNSNGVKGKSAVFYLEKAHDKFWRLSYPIEKA